MSAMYPSMQPPAAPEPVAETLITSAPKPTPAAQSSDPDATLAEKLFPAMQKALASEPPPPATAPDPDQKTAERLFNSDPEPFVDSNAPAEVQALREADPNRRMYSAQDTYKTDLPLSLFEKIEGDDITPEAREHAAGVWREVAADLELAPADLRELVPVFQAERPSEEVQASNRSASLQWLVAEHGDRAGFALEAAQALVARDPRVAALLDHSGAGDDVRVVKKIVAAALRQVASGKLKMPKK